MGQVKQVTTSTVLGLRGAILRPGKPAEASRYENDDDPSTIHMAYVKDEDVHGVATFLRQPCPEEPLIRVRLRGMAVKSDAQSSGIGRAILTTAQKLIAESMWCNARVSARGFYEKLGWQAYGEVFELPHIGPHVRMRWLPTKGE